MPELSIDRQVVEVPEGATLLDAAGRLGIDIPTLCHLEEVQPFTSCMMCSVHDAGSGRMLPACSTPARHGMAIDTDSPPVRAARKEVLELLLSEHVGNCEGPCRQACPAGLNIPALITCLEEGRVEEASEMARQQLVLPAVVERICPAYCEMACRRGLIDHTVPIRLLVRRAVEASWGTAGTLPPAREGERNRQVAIVGAGPAGLACAVHLRRHGYPCTVFDDHDDPGGTLRYGIPEAKLPRHVLEADLAALRPLGITLRMNTHVGRDLPVNDLHAEFDAVVLAVGKIKPEVPGAFGVDSAYQGIAVQPVTFRTSSPSVFAGGDAVRALRVAVKSIADGAAIATSVHQFLQGHDVTGPTQRFNSRIGCPQRDEMGEFLKGVDRSDRIGPAGGAGEGYTDQEARREAGRCLHCECLKPDTCKLRNYAEEYAASQDLYRHRERTLYQRVLEHKDVLYEPGKCIRCGLCVRLAAQAGEPLGLAFIGRGADMRVAVPFNRPLAEGLQSVAGACVEACPTAALAWRGKMTYRKEES